MSNASSNTVKLHRVMCAPPERVYKAFTDAAAMAKWLPPNGFTCTVHELDAKVGGRHRMSFTNFSTGNGHSFGGTYLEAVPGQRLVYTDVFEGGGLPGEMTTTVTFTQVSVGTELSIVQAGVPSVIPLDGCYVGWHQSLLQLAALVEPSIPD